MSDFWLNDALDTANAYIENLDPRKKAQILETRAESIAALDAHDSKGGSGGD